MEKYKIIVFVEEIRKCLDTGDAQKALELAKQIDIKKVKSRADLGVLAEAYFRNKDYKKARELFLMIYESTKSRRVLTQLVHLSIKLEDVAQATYYLLEFKKVAPNDVYQYIFQFSIDRMKGEPVETLIEDLKALKASEYMEIWGYELAKLYYKAGRIEECIQECDDLTLWFGKGEYVERAKALKGLCTGEVTIDDLSARQQNKDQEEESQEEESQEVINAMEEPDEKIASFVAENNLDLLSIFSGFIKIDGLRSQIYNCLHTIIDSEKKDTALIITGDRESGKTRLGRSFAKLYKELDLVKSRKIALISAEKLNEMDLFEKKDQLRDCVIIVEQAGILTKETIKMLLNLNQSLEGRIIIILEDTREEINELLRGYAQLKNIFRNRVHLSRYSHEELFLFVEAYLAEREYQLTDDALLAINKYLKKAAKENEFTLKTLYEKMDQLIHVCDERNTGELRAMGEALSLEHSSLGSISKQDVISIEEE